MAKGIMVHYLAQNSGINYDGYKEAVKSEHPEFRHLFFPSVAKEGIEIVQYPDSDSTDSKEVIL